MCVLSWRVGECVCVLECLCELSWSVCELLCVCMSELSGNCVLG